MTTVRDVLAETRHHLMTGKSDRLNQLENAVAAGATTLTLKHEIKGVSDGSRLAVDLEEYYVLSVNGTTPGSTVTVIPAFEGSCSSAHAADSIVRIGPNFTDFWIAKHINQSLSDLSGEGLFRIKDLQFDYQPAQAGYELTAADLIDVWRVKVSIPGPSLRWPILSRRSWAVDKDANTAEFPSGTSLTLTEPGFPGRPIHVSYKAGFDPLFDFTAFDPTTDYALDVATVTGLHPEAHPLLALSSAIDLLGGREVKRTFMSRQPEPRRQEEVPVGGASQAMRPLLALYAEGFIRERRRLKRQYPEQVY